MRLEQQVCRLELAKRLKELGVKPESLFVWTTITTPETLWSLDRFEERFDPKLPGTIGDEYAAFTVSEPAAMFPAFVQENRALKMSLAKDRFKIYFHFWDDDDSQCDGKNKNCLKRVSAVDTSSC